MIKINEKNYELCLFDTCALSNFLKEKKQWLEYYSRNFDIGKTIICFSVFTLSELWFRKDLFAEFINFFSVFPSAILDGHQSILNKEVEVYETVNAISPIVMCPFAVKEEGLSQKEVLLKVFEKSGFIQKTEYWKRGQKDVLDGIMQLIKNYPPKKDTYTIKEINLFVELVSLDQLCLRNKDFFVKETEAKRGIILDRLPSLKATLYTVFYKFYPDRRKPRRSDVFDIIISSLLPYVDYFIAEKNLCEIIDKIKKRHGFLLNVEPIALNKIFP